MNQEQELIFFRTILLNETKSNEERRNAQIKIMEILNLKEDNNTKNGGQN